MRLIPLTVVNQGLVVYWKPHALFIACLVIAFIQVILSVTIPYNWTRYCSVNFTPIENHYEKLISWHVLPSDIKWSGLLLPLWTIQLDRFLKFQKLADSVYSWFNTQANVIWASSIFLCFSLHSQTIEWFLPILFWLLLLWQR